MRKKKGGSQFFSGRLLGVEEHEAMFHPKESERLIESVESSFGLPIAPDCPYPQSVVNKFESRVQRLGNGCWRWTGGKCEAGLGRFCIKRGQHTTTARASFNIYREDISGNTAIWIIRTEDCPTYGCCNPNHLRKSDMPSTDISSFVETGKKYRFKKGKVNPRGSKAYSAKITERQAIEIRVKRLRDKVTFQKLADDYGISTRAIQKIVNGETWTHIPTELDDCLNYLKVTC